MTQPSPEQLAFFEELRSGSSSILLSAVAGSGKTTTIVQACQFLPPNLLVRFLAFNKNIAEELSKRLPPFVQTGTFHSCAFRALGRTGKFKVNKDKVKDILKEAQRAKKLTFQDLQTYGQFVTRLVSYAKNAGLGTALAPINSDTLYALVAHNTMTLDEGGSVERALTLAERVLVESNEDQTSVDFDDMLYLALLRNVSFDKASYIFVDEGQDTNRVQASLLPRMLGPTGRLIVVGDKRQAMYGFRGASSNALDELKAQFSMKEMTLSVSWRCSKAVVKEAQRYFN